MWPSDEDDLSAFGELQESADVDDAEMMSSQWTGSQLDRASRDRIRARGERPIGLLPAMSDILTKLSQRRTRAFMQIGAAFAIGGSVALALIDHAEARALSAATIGLLTIFVAKLSLVNLQRLGALRLSTPAPAPALDRHELDEVRAGAQRALDEVSRLASVPTVGPHEVDEVRASAQKSVEEVARLASAGDCCVGGSGTGRRACSGDSSSPS
jgi:hypothetical protein